MCKLQYSPVASCTSKQSRVVAKNSAKGTSTRLLLLRACNCRNVEIKLLSLEKIGCSSDGGSSRARVQLALQLTTLRRRLMTERWAATKKDDNLTVLNQQANMVCSVEVSH
ncbi:hypothetical protein T09_13304 [Trichinella sp. T9]|nr:hypothetical protein T09_13304 [Trichinella sp. T9]